MGVGSGLVMSSLLFLIVNKTIGEASPAFMDWGWRIPFLFSAVLIAIALVRAAERRRDTGVRRAEGARCRVGDAAGRAVQEPAARGVLAAGSMIGFFTLGYMANAYFMGYAHTHVGFSPDLILSVGLLGGVVVVVFNALSAVLSDIFGRRRVIMAALAVGVPWAFVVLPLIDTGNAVLFALAMTGTYAVAASSYGPMAAFIPEIFGTRYRYSGAGLSLNLAGLVGGAVPTIAAAPLLASWGVGAIGADDGGRRAGQPGVHRQLPETKGVALH